MIRTFAFQFGSIAGIAASCSLWCSSAFALSPPVKLTSPSSPVVHVHYDDYVVYAVPSLPLGDKFPARIYSRHGYFGGPPVVTPPPPPIVYPAPPVLYELVPVRPASCGVYRYWNGVRCADARFRPPYIGPRW